MVSMRVYISLTLPDRFFPFIFGWEIPIRIYKRKKAVWQRETMCIYLCALINLYVRMVAK